MVVRVTNGGYAAPLPGEFDRPAQAAGRYQPGSSTHAIMPNRNAQVTVEVGPPTVPIDSIHQLVHGLHLEGAGMPGGEVVMGTGVIVQPRTNDEWISGGVASYDGPIRIADNPTFGRGVVDAAPGPVSRWAPSYPGDPGTEDKTS